MYVLDTDHATLYQRANPALARRIENLPPQQLATTVITYEEQVSGRMAMVRRAQTENERIQAYYWLRHTLEFFCRTPVLPFHSEAARQFAALKPLRLKIGTQDLLIASIVLAQKATLLTRNSRHFSQIPGLLIEDWSIVSP